MLLDEKESRRRFLLRVAGALDRRVYIGPKTLQLHITNRCNLSCCYCWYHFPGSELNSCVPKDFSYKKFQEIVHDCVDLKVDWFCFSASGEPTTHPRFKDMISFIVKRPLAVMLFTNGTFSKELLSSVANVDRLVINLAAVDRDGYRLLQGEDLFDRVIENIQELVRLRDLKNPLFRIEIVFIVNKANVHKIPEARAMFKKLRVNAFTFKKMSEGRHNRKLRVDIKGNSLIKQGSPVATCFEGWFGSLIKLNKKVCLCCQLENLEVSDIKTISFRQAWFSPEVMRVRLMAKSGELARKFDDCRDCCFKERQANVVKEVLMLKALKKIKRTTHLFE